MEQNNRTMTSGFILIVDDEEDVCYLLKRLLIAKGYMTKCCFSLHDCKEAIAHDRKPDMILLDINLTDGNGLSLLEEKILPQETKVIVMSARSHLENEALAKGANKFIAKPFSPSKLIELIEAERLAG